MTLVAFGLFVMGCEAPTTPTVDDLSLSPLFSSNGVVHHVSMGGADICEALGLPTGCDANFSLVANETADGSVSGQWQDSFGHGNGGIHVDVDCLNVVGNQAWVSGVITKGNFQDVDFTGLPAITRVVDNGTSKNDPADQLSFSFIGFPVDCNDEPNLPLFDLTNGQVKVR